MNLMTVLSYLYGIMMDFSINSPGHGKMVFNGRNATSKCYLKEQIKLLGKLTINDTLKIGILPIVSKDVSINFAEQCFKTLTNNDRLNGLKGINKIQKRKLIYKYKPFY